MDISTLRSFRTMDMRWILNFLNYKCVKSCALKAGKAAQRQLAMEIAAKKWPFSCRVSPHHRWKKGVLVFSLLGLALMFMLLAALKADSVIKSVLPAVRRSTEPSGSELQEQRESGNDGK
eukprot:Skav236051  [mRNA]  locus=scaffold2566:42070:43031:+ [translate_table: standard]